ncbi:MAG: TetR/AcrR family transcriptional regulator [Pirellulaceae bacterium]
MMTVLTRKQREIQERQQRILTVAREMLMQGGYLGLSMDRIATALEYSKGTIYQHFACKEDIILALVNDSQQQRCDFFERAATFRGRPRERLAAIGYASELFVRLHPDYFNVEQIVRASSIWEKTSLNGRTIMRSCESRCIGIVSGIIRDGVAQGDLTLPEELAPEDMVFGLWAMTFGGYSIIATSSSLEEVGIREPFEAINQNITRVLDGYGWRPLASEHDYSAVLVRIAEEIFRDETERLQSG